MSQPDYAKNIDADHAAIRKHIRDELHYEWVDSFRLGFGFPDAIVIARNGIPVMLEIKSPGKGQNANEIEFQERMKKAGYWFYFVVYSVEDVKQAIEHVEEYKIEVKREWSE